MEPGGLRNIEQIQEREGGEGGGRLGGLILASIGCACAVFAGVALLRRPAPAVVKVVDPLDALVARGAPSIPTRDLSAQDVTFPSMLSDSQHPTTALAALQGAAAPSGSAAFVLPPGVPTFPPPPGDRLPVVPMPAQRVLSASSVVTDPQDPLTTAAKDRSAFKGTAVEEGRAGAYNLQVASFRTEGEAQSFATVLRQRGHKAYIEAAAIAGRGIWHRVRIGPFKYLRDATKYRSDFEAREHIVPFVIETEKEKKLAEVREQERRTREAKRR
ncbi:MAG: SPOR domain-containing protein [Myxococcales bacterium]|nr:MAG: SPOR domain-containing protein [Myxococcales bacterium]